MWLVHEHNNSTSAIDKYWLFNEYKSANLFVKEYVQNNKDFLDKDFLKELYELNSNEDNKSFHDFFLDYIENPPNNIINLVNDNYVIITKFNENNYARRF